MNVKLLVLASLLCGCASTTVDEAKADRGSTPAVGYLDESLCSLRVRADQSDLWGDLIRIEGIYRTDRQTFGWLKAQCEEGEIGGIEFARLQSLGAPGLEPMANAVLERCGSSAFCAYAARVVVVGRLVKDESAMYGMQLDLVEVQSFEMIDEQ